MIIRTGKTLKIWRIIVQRQVRKGKTDMADMVDMGNMTDIAKMARMQI